MTDVSNELLANLLMEMNQKTGQRLQNIENFLIGLGQGLEQEHGGAIEGRVKMYQAHDRVLALLGRMMARQLPQGQIENLAAVEFSVASQWGEDGIIEWLVSHVPVPNQRFVEFGVQNFTEANCRFLIANRNWKGLVMDGSAEYMQQLQESEFYWKYDLTALNVFITIDNIDTLITENGFAGPLGILSIDIDGNDYWVWERIESVDAAIVIAEYNPHFGDVYPVTIPYDATFKRLEGHYSGYYFGASIAALKLLAAEKGYDFVGTNSNGNNAFFVRKDLAHHVLPLLKEQRAFPARYRDSRDKEEKLTYIGGMARFDLIRDLPVIDVTTGRQILLRDLKQPYSEEWQRGMS